MKKILLVSLLFGATGLAAFSQSALQPAGAAVPGVAAAADAPCEAPITSKKTLSGWTDLGRYKLDNATLAAPAAGEKRVVFFGSSTTDNWGRKFDSVFFPGEPYVNRGISGETSPQMLLRFQQDVVELKPAAVVFLGGTNDPAGNSGPITLETTEANIEAMAAIAQTNGIKMILASQLPVTEFPWNKCVHPGADLLAMSAWEKAFAAEKHLGYIDYYAVLVGDDGNYKPGLSPDGVHPNKQAYELMTPVAEDVIRKILKQR
jgi:lysophospholipase L1-like esterase